MHHACVKIKSISFLLGLEGSKKHSPLPKIYNNIVLCGGEFTGGKLPGSHATAIQFLLLFYYYSFIFIKKKKKIVKLIFLFDLVSHNKQF